MRVTKSPFGKHFVILDHDEESVGTLNRVSHSDGTLYLARIEGRPEERFVTLAQALQWIKQQ